MKTSIFTILTYPILSLIVYSCIVTGSVYFYGPLIMMQPLGVLALQWNAILGVIGMVLTLLSLFRRYEIFQLWGTILMIVGLVPSLRSSIHSVRQITLTHPLSMILIPLFGILSLLVFYRFYVVYRKR